ncbi:MAG: PilN domain-containing protein [Burkholderiaceae bacterium]|nr:PilN domain-containing protein [Burkholderiaceae bacterium]
MIRINLLPHREARREARKKDFVAQMILAAVVGLGVTLIGGVIINQMISSQAARNDFISRENAKLDEQIKEIATLKAELEGLRARAQAVENLQRDRTVPVHLLDELVKNTPEGILLKSVKQKDGKVVLNGYAQSNDRISELLHNIATKTPWLERPELNEIKAVLVPTGTNTKDARRLFEFTLNALLKATEKPADAKGVAKKGPSAGARPGQPAPKG